MIAKLIWMRRNLVNHDKGFIHPNSIVKTAKEELQGMLKLATIFLEQMQHKWFVYGRSLLQGLTKAIGMLLLISATVKLTSHRHPMSNSSTYCRSSLSRNLWDSDGCQILSRVWYQLDST